MLLVSSGSRVRVLLTTPHAQSGRPQQRIVQPDVMGAKVEKHCSHITTQRSFLLTFCQHFISFLSLSLSLYIHIYI